MLSITQRPSVALEAGARSQWILKTLSVFIFALKKAPSLPYMKSRQTQPQRKQARHTRSCDSGHGEKGKDLGNR